MIHNFCTNHRRDMGLVAKCSLSDFRKKRPTVILRFLVASRRKSSIYFWNIFFAQKNHNVGHNFVINHRWDMGLVAKCSLKNNKKITSNQIWRTRYRFLATWCSNPVTRYFAKIFDFLRSMLVSTVCLWILCVCTYLTNDIPFLDYLTLKKSCFFAKILVRGRQLHILFQNFSTRLDI